MTRRVPLVVALVAATLAQPAPALADADPTETSASGFFARDVISVPDDRRAIDLVRATAGCGAVDGRYRVDGDPSDWRGVATMINGTGRYDAGEYIWTDYPYDDAGTGTLRYPGEGEGGKTGEGQIPQGGPVADAPPRVQRYGNNAADVVELRLAADASHLYVLAELNFLNAVDTTVIGLGFDTTSGGFDAWPLGARLSTPDIDLFVTLYGTCGSVTTASGTTPLGGDGAVAVDTATNTIEAAIPRSLLGDATSLRLVGGSGLWDAGSDMWMAPTQGGGRANATDRPTGGQSATDPAVFNLLFRSTEPVVDPNFVTSTSESPRTFQTQKQQAALRAGTTGEHAVTLALDRIEPGASSDPVPLRPGTETLFTRSYHSRLDLEGVFLIGNMGLWLGPRNPYAVFVPSCFEAGCAGWPDGDVPLVVTLHGGSASHIQALDPASAQRLGERVGAVSASPLGRGRRVPWWRGPGEADVLEVLDDARDVYGTHHDRQVVVGASLGGYGTLRLGSLYPDLWAGAFAICPAAYENSTSSREPGNVAPDQTQRFVVDTTIPSLLNVPLGEAAGTADPLVPITTDRRIRDRAIEAGLDLRYTEHVAGTHCFGAGGEWQPMHTAEVASMLDAGRRARPSRVRYAIDPRHYPADPEPLGVADIREAGVTYVGAYWVSGLAVRPEAVAAAAAGQTYVAGNLIDGAGEEVVASIDAVSHGAGGWSLAVEGCGTGAGLDANPDLESAVPEPHLYQCHRQVWSGASENVLDLDVRNLSAAAIDLSSARLDPDAPLRIDAAGDGSLGLTLVGAGPGTASGSCVESVAGTTLVLDLTTPCTVTWTPD